MPDTAFAKSMRSMKSESSEQLPPLHETLYFQSFACSTAALVLLHLRWATELKGGNSKARAMALLRSLIAEVFAHVTLAWHVILSQVMPADVIPPGTGDLTVQVAKGFVECSSLCQLLPIILGELGRRLMIVLINADGYDNPMVECFCCNSSSLTSPFHHHYVIIEDQCVAGDSPGTESEL